MPGEQDNLNPTVYEIRLKGHLDLKWSEWLYDLTLTHESDGTTTLSGPLPDQTILHSVLARIRDLNLPLISVCLKTGVAPIEPNSDAPSSEDESQAKSQGSTYACPEPGP